MAFRNKTSVQGALPDAAAADSDAKAVDAAWKIHQAQMDWTTRADAKAVFAFTIESASVTAALTMVTQGKVLSSNLPCWQLLLFWVGLLILLTGAGFAALFVIPRLREKSMLSEHRKHYIYFGHVRLWKEAELISAIKNNSILEQLSFQIINTAEIAWQKHKRGQWSLTLGIAGAGILFLFACIRSAG